MRDPIISIVIYTENNPRLLRVSVTWWHPVGRNRGRPVKHMQIYSRPGQVLGVIAQLLHDGPTSIR